MHEPGDVVEGGERDVLGDPQPPRPYGVQRAQRHQVVGGEDDLGRLVQVEEALRGPPPALRLEVALADVRAGKGEPVCAERLAEGVDALASGGRGSGPRDDREPPVPESVQVRDEVPHGRPPVGPDDGHVHAGDPAVDEHHRRPGPRGGQHTGGAAVGGGDEQAVDPPVEQRRHVVVLEVGPLVGVPDDDAVAERAGLLLDGTGQLGEVRVHDVADDQAQGAGPVGAQRTGDGVRAVAQRLDGGLHAAPCGGADGRVAVERTGDRRDGQPRLGGDVLDARHRRFHLLVESITRRIGNDYTGRDQEAG